MKIASIDIGTNAIKSKIFETTPASIKYIDGIRSPIRLGKEVFEDGKLSDKKLKQLTKTLQKYQKKFKKDKIDQYEIVATSAFRNTSNSEEARRYVENKIEHPIRIISGFHNMIFSKFFRSKSWKLLLNMPSAKRVGETTKLSFYHGRSASCPSVTHLR